LSEEVRTHEAIVHEVREGDAWHVITAFRRRARTHSYVVERIDGDRVILKRVKEDKGNPRERRALASDIVEAIRDEIREQMPKIVKSALSDLKVDILKEIKGELEKGEKPKLKRKKRCLWLRAGSKEYYIQL